MVGNLEGEAVGADVVGLLVGDTVGPELVGETVGGTVGMLVGTGTCTDPSRQR